MNLNRTLATIYLVDDDHAVLQSLKHLLTAACYHPICFTSPNQFLEQYQPIDGSCLLLDMAMAGMDGLAVQRTLQKVDSCLPIIFLTGRGSIPMSVEAMKHGAVDFLAKPIEEALLLQTINIAVRKAQVELASNRIRKRAREQIAALTEREREVLDCIVGGMLNKEIASSLEITERTVKFHRANLMQKFGVQHLAGLIMLIDQAEPLHCSPHDKPAL